MAPSPHKELPHNPHTTTHTPHLLAHTISHAAHTPRSSFWSCATPSSLPPGCSPSRGGWAASVPLERPILPTGSVLPCFTCSGNDSDRQAQCCTVQLPRCIEACNVPPRLMLRHTQVRQDVPPRPRALLRGRLPRRGGVHPLPDRHLQVHEAQGAAAPREPCAPPAAAGWAAQRSARPGGCHAGVPLAGSGWPPSLEMHSGPGPLPCRTWCRGREAPSKWWGPACWPPNFWARW